MTLLSKFAREDGQSLLHVPLIRAVRQECGFDEEVLPPLPATRARKRRPAVYRDSPRHFNLDEHVLRPDQLTRTCMTPYIDRLKRKYHPSWVVDSEVVHWDHDDEEITEPNVERIAEEHEHLLDCVRRARDDGDDAVRVRKRNTDGDVISVRVGPETYNVRIWLHCPLPIHTYLE